MQGRDRRGQAEVVGGAGLTASDRFAVRGAAGRIAGILLIATVLVACHAGASATPSSETPLPSSPAAAGSGIQITARAGPVCPVERVPPDPACAPRPVVGATIAITDATGHEAGSVVTDAAGAASITLAPGDYTVTAQAVGGLMRVPGETTVTVRDGAMTAVELDYDTGIR